MTAITELVTHNGKFHADEVLASVILTRLFPNADLYRSRKAEMISPAPGRIVFDVGSVFDPALGLFDHHQPGAPVRDCGTPYSAFGLIWREFGHSWLSGRVSADVAEDVFARIDKDIVSVVDAVDNGKLAPAEAGPFSGMTIFSMIENFAPGWRNDDEVDSNLAFRQACTFAQSFLDEWVRTVSMQLEADTIVRGKVAKTDGPILTLPRGMPWHGPIFEPGAEHILMVVHPRSDGCWVVSTVPQEPGSYETRMDLPEAWASLEHEALQEASGIASAVFCHRARFMAVVGNAADAVAMAEEAIRIAGKEPALSL